MTTRANGLTISDTEKTVKIDINKTPKKNENIIVKSDFNRRNSSVSALRRSRRAAYEM